MMKRTFLLVMLLLVSVFSLAGRSFYWDTPTFVSNRSIRFLEADSNAEGAAAVWQEYTGTTQGSAVRFYLAVDGSEGWEQYPDIIPPLEFSGIQAPLTSIARLESGSVFVAIASGEGEISIVGWDEGQAPEISSTVTAEATLLSPRLFEDAGGGLILFVTMSFPDSIALYFSRSADGVEWDPLQPLIDDEDLKLNYLPSYAVFDGNEYVVFQSRVADEESGRNAFQLYLTWRPADGEWTDPRWITDFGRVGSGIDQRSTQYDNQRAFLGSLEEGLAVVWERKISTTASTNEIYYLEISRMGIPGLFAEVVTSGDRLNSEPSLIVDEGDPLVFWYDNRTGQGSVVLSARDGLIWEESILSQMSGASAFPEPLITADGLEVLWENTLSGRNRVVELKPDRYVASPNLFPVNFPSGARVSLDSAVFRWSNPIDSSGIRGFSYSWSQDSEVEPPREVMSYESLATEAFPADEDGIWYFKVRSEDYAGNWSDPSLLTFFRDTTPPEPVDFIVPLTDRYGNLLSSTFTLEWQPSPSEDVAGYHYVLDYLGDLNAPVDPFDPILTATESRILTTGNSVSYVNRINGQWALSVSAVDDVGNKADPSVLFFSTDEFIPFTYVSYIDSRQDELGKVRMNIYGRGFLADGSVEEIYVDRDDREPWDYVFRVEDGDFSIGSDFLITGIGIDDVDAGEYRVILNHSSRGLYYAGARITLESTGNVKYGDYTQEYQRQWTLSPRALLYLSPSDILFWMILLIMAILVIAAFFVVMRTWRENRRFAGHAVALITGEDFADIQKKQRLKEMKKRGFGLRLKFILSIQILVTFIILMISYPLGTFMIDVQKESLVEGLRNRADVLLEGLASGARTYLPIQNELELRLLPRQTENIDEFFYATITGQGVIDKDDVSYVWASNDEDLRRKYVLDEVLLESDYRKVIDYLNTEGDSSEFASYFTENGNGNYQIREDLADESLFYMAAVLADAGLQEAYEAGKTRIFDPVSREIASLREEVEADAATSVAPLLEELTALNQQRQQYIFNTDEASQAEAQNLLAASQRVQDQIDTELGRMGRVFGSYPELDVETLGDGGPEYYFYKPVLFERLGEEQFYRGTIRLGVSVEKILTEIEESQTQLIYRTGIFAAIAVLLGLIGSLLLSAITIKPIKLLVEGVSVIRDTEDKALLKEHKITVKSRDELAELAETVNQMTEGLVKAAAASKDLTVGKDVQKMFIPLEMNSEGRKLTTGSEETDMASFFGYYEGAKGVSGDYFDFRKLDDRHYAIIKCDVAGKGVPASLIMVEVATIFLSHFTGWKKSKEGMDLQGIAYRMNDLLEERGFKGRFAALILAIFDSKTGDFHMCNAGDKLVHMYIAEKQEMIVKTLPESPATGIFPSFMIEMKNPYLQQKIRLSKGDTVFFFTDGIEEAQRKFRDASFQLTSCQEPGLKEGDSHDNHSFGSTFEELGIPRIQEIVNAVKKQQVYVLKKHHDPTAALLEFDFTDCEGSTQDAVMAMVAVERVFRIYPDPAATSEDRIMVDIKVDEFLQLHFNQYREYFKHRIENTNRPEYVYYTHLKEDEQFDDLTILGICKY